MNISFSFARNKRKKKFSKCEIRVYWDLWKIPLLIVKTIFINAVSFLSLFARQRKNRNGERKERKHAFLLVSSILIDSNKICHSESVENKPVKAWFSSYSESIQFIKTNINRFRIKHRFSPHPNPLLLGEGNSACATSFKLFCIRYCK